LHRLASGSYIELPCNEITAAAATRLYLDRQRVITTFNQKAAAWWQTVLNEPLSFLKPVYQLGLGGVQASNVELAGAVSLDGDSLSVMGVFVSMAAGKVGDGICCRVNVSGMLRFWFDSHAHWMRFSGLC
jgi:hypothetical protein